jgi:fucose permease
VVSGSLLPPAQAVIRKTVHSAKIKQMYRFIILLLFVIFASTAKDITDNIRLQE